MKSTRVPVRSLGSAGAVYLSAFVAILLVVGALGLEKTEAEWMVSTTYSKGQTQMIYVFVTNRPASQTHPSPSPAPTPASIVSPEPSPSPLINPSPNPTPASTNASNPAPSKKRDVDMLEMILNGTNSTSNSTPTSDVPAPDPSPVLSPPSTVSPSPVVPSPAPVNGTVSPAPPIILPDDLYLKSIFLPGVDNLALLKIPELAYFNNTAVYEAYRAKYPNLVIYLQYGNGTSAIKSTRKRFWALNKIVGSFSALVSLNSGVVTGISWDDGCYECDVDHCLEDNCTIEPIDCTGHRCNLKVYLGWVGTDNQGLYCSSAGQMPSSYRTFSFGHAFLYAANAIQNTALTIIGSVQYK